VPPSLPSCVRAAHVSRDRLVNDHWGCARVRCAGCGRGWVAVYRLDTEWPVECPGCHEVRGEVADDATVAA
jgi:hypothetical protein